MAEYQYTAVFEPAVEGGYIVTVPALPGLVTEGDTLEEARATVIDAIRGYLESLIKHGEEIPIEPAPASIEQVAVKSLTLVPRLPVCTSAEVIGALLRAGFYIDHSSGSHRFLRHRSQAAS